jgi:hypothetical protein
MESGVFTNPLGGTDRHIAMVNKGTCEFSEIYNWYPSGVGNALGCPTCTAQSAAKYDGNAFALLTTGAVDAAGLPIQPLQYRLADFLQPGEITHMGRFTMANGYISNGLTNARFVWPATAYSTEPGGLIPYGSVLRLKASYDISGFSATAQKILIAWKHYGVILADGGATIEVSADTDLSEDPTVWKAIEELRTGGPLLANYEFVDQSSLETVSSSNSAAVKFDNAYQVPDSFAVVIAEDTTSHVQTKVYVALQGVTVGVPHATEFYQAGATASQLTSWVNGSANQSVTWAMSPSVGTLTSGGLYTPPGTVVNPTDVVFTGTSAADSNAKAYIKVTVWPTGTIRVNSGNTTADVSDGTNTWYKEFGWNSPQSFSAFNPIAWPAIYYDYRYSGGDQVYRFNLANGNYKLTLKNGIVGSSGVAVPSNQFINTYDVNGQIAMRELDLAGTQSGFNTVATDLVLPMWVQDGTAYFAIRQLTDVASGYSPLVAPRGCAVLGYPNVMCFPQVGAFSIEADSTPAHLTIDGSTAALAGGATRQFYSVGWYMPGTATWSVESGPGAIDSSGLYTASGAGAVAVKSTSTVDGTKTATLPFNVSAGAGQSISITGSASFGGYFKIEYIAPTALSWLALTNSQWTALTNSQWTRMAALLWPSLTNSQWTSINNYQWQALGN